MNSLTQTLVIASESGIPASSPLAKLSVPLGIAIFLGLPYMLLRSNIGTRRAYLVIANSFFGFMFLLSLFWWFGAPGTPAATGPTNLPGQPTNEYAPTWVPFAEDSTIAETDPYAAVVGDPGAFSEEVPAGVDGELGASETKSFFTATEGEYAPAFPTSYEVAEGPLYAEAANGRPVIRVTFGQTYQPDTEGELPEGVETEDVGTVIPEGEEGAGSYTAYAFFDAGSPTFPSLVFVLVSLLGFAIHAPLLYADERRERQEGQEVEVAEERVPARV